MAKVKPEKDETSASRGHGSTSFNLDGLTGAKAKDGECYCPLGQGRTKQILQVILFHQSVILHR